MCLFLLWSQDGKIWTSGYCPDDQSGEKFGNYGLLGRIQPKVVCLREQDNVDRHRGPQTGCYKEKGKPFQCPYQREQNILGLNWRWKDLV